MPEKGEFEGRSPLKNPLSTVIVPSERRSEKGEFEGRSPLKNPLSTTDLE
jgi:hypothetical protein